jgi:hypothetical protein
MATTSSMLGSVMIPIHTESNLQIIPPAKPLGIPAFRRGGLASAAWVFRLHPSGYTGGCGGSDRPAANPRRLILGGMTGGRASRLRRVSVAGEWRQFKPTQLKSTQYDV